MVSRESSRYIPVPKSTTSIVSLLGIKTGESLETRSNRLGLKVQQVESFHRLFGYDIQQVK